MDQPVLFTSHLGSEVKVNSSPVEDLKQGLRLLESFRGKELSYLEETKMRMLAGWNYVEAQREFARYLLLKPGMSSVEAQEACGWLKIAMSLGDLDAKVMLGGCYYRGIGVPRDLQIARELYFQASTYEHPIAQYHLGLMWGRGEGVSQDYVMAYRWVKRAALQSYAPALSSLQTLRGMLTPGQLQEAESSLPNE